MPGGTPPSQLSAPESCTPTSRRLGCSRVRSRRAGAFRSRPPSTELAQLHEAIGDSWDRAGEFQKAADAYTAARRLVDDVPRSMSPDCCSNARRWRRSSGTTLRRSRGSPAPGACWWTSTAPEAASRSAQLSAWYATVLQAEGRTADAVPWCERAVAEAERAGDKEALAQAYNVLEWVDIMMGRSDGRHLQKALAIYERARRPPRSGQDPHEPRRRRVLLRPMGRGHRVLGTRARSIRDGRPARGRGLERQQHGRGVARQ